jgi:hypothetical protein
MKMLEKFTGVLCHTEIDRRQNVQISFKSNACGGLEARFPFGMNPASSHLERD